MSDTEQKLIAAIKRHEQKQRQTSLATLADLELYERAAALTTANTPTDSAAPNTNTPTNTNDTK